MGEEQVPIELGSNREKVGRGHPPAEHRFKPGQVANPAGRPKRALVTDQIIRLLKQKNPKTGKPYAQAVAEGLIKELAKGKNAKELLDRIEGPVAQAIEHSGPGGEAINVTHTLDKDAILALADSIRDNER